MFARNTLGAINWSALARSLAVFSIGLSLMGALAVSAPALPDRVVPANPIQGQPAPEGDFQQSVLPRPIPTDPAGTIFHAAGAAEGGGFTAYMADRSTTIALKVWRFNAAAPPLRQTVLFYISYSDSSQTYDCAYGPIPDGDLSGPSAGSLHLNTNTSVNKEPDFYRCGAGGVINVLFKDDAMMQRRDSGDAQNAYGNILYRSIQQAAEFSAIAGGSVYGIALPDTEGEIEHAHHIDLTIERTFCPPPCQ